MTAITYHSWKFLKLEATPRGWTFEPVHWTVFSALAWTIFREGREYYLLRTWGAFWRHRKLTRKVTWYLIRKSSFKLSLAYRYVGLAGSRYQIIIKILSPRLPAPEERKCLTIKSFRSWAASEVCLSDTARLHKNCCEQNCEETSLRMLKILVFWIFYSALQRCGQWPVHLLRPLQEPALQVSGGHPRPDVQTLLVPHRSLLLRLHKSAMQSHSTHGLC